MSVTEQDRKQAATVIAQRWAIDGPDGDVDDRALVEAFAQALADERERARAPFLALADRLDEMGDEVSMHWAADRIRTAAEESHQ